MPNYPTIAGYQITALLGRGGMATVYAARQEGLDREVAIKVVELGERDAGQYILRFENEAQALARLHHPHIVGLYGYGRTVEGLPYYVMPLLDGGDLSVRPRPMAEDALLALLDPLLDALAHAHAAGIIHRDIKPENILFDSDGRPLLADFGAALRQSSSRLTETGVTIGSVGYMSPEQARGQAVDASSDLYSLAVVAYECLTGQAPFSGPDALAVAIAQLEGPPPTLPTGLRHWQRFFDRALAPHASQRFADAAAMRAGLGEIGTRLTAVRPAVETALPTARRWPPLAAGALLLGAFAAVLAWWTGQPHFDADKVRQLVADGAWQAPTEPNALDLLLAAPQPRTPDWEAARLQLLAAAIGPLQDALERDDWTAMEAELPRWRALATQLEADGLPPVQQLQHRLAGRIRQQFADALVRYDRAWAAAALRIYPLLPEDPELASLQAQVAALPLEGEGFADPAGPMLVLLQRPSATQAGLAITAEPITTALYQEYAQARGLTPRSCAPERGHQGCLSRREASELAEWLSQHSDYRYRLPSRDELLAHADRVQADGLLAWTDTCVTVTTVQQPNAAQRAWGGVKSVFGGRKAQPKVEHSCAGYYAVALQAGTPSTQNAPAPGPRSAVVLLAELPATLPE